MRREMKAFDTKDNLSYVCKGKIDWGISVLAVLLSIMGILASINFLDETNALYINRQIVMLILESILMLIVSRISYHFFAKKAQILLTLVFVIVMIRYLLVKVDIVHIETRYGLNWFEVGSFYIYVPAILLTLGVFSLSAVGEFKRIADILDTRKGILFTVGITVAGLYCCDSMKYLLIYILIVGLVIYIRFPKVLIMFIYAIALFTVYAGDYFLTNSVYSGRISTFLDPFSSIEGFELANGLYMIYSGGFLGQGIGGGNGVLGGQGITNFLVCKLIQDMGWGGLMCFILLFVVLSWRIVLTITKAPDRVGFYLAVSIFLIFLVEFLGNMMVNLNLIPFVGIPLPFCGTENQSVLIDYVLLGVVLNISRHKIERAEI